MAYRHGNRKQKMLLPPSVEEFVPTDAPVRVYDELIEAMDIKALGIELNNRKVGCPQYDPKAMLKLFVYGYSYGVRSCRKLERACHYDLSFIWLMGGLKPDYKTIAEFRRRNKGALSQVMKQCARMCIDLNLIEGNVLFVDGTRIRASADIQKGRAAEWYRKMMKALDRRIEELLAASEAEDEAEAAAGSLVQVEAELADARERKKRIREGLAEMKRQGRTYDNDTDPDCCLIRGRQGVHAGYNGQIVVDDANGLIVSSDVVNESTDSKQLAPQIKQAQEVLGQASQAVCADSGYVNYGEIAEADLEQIDVIMPSQQQATGEEIGPFNKRHFRYDEEQDCYYCPKGERLNRNAGEPSRKYNSYTAGVVCRSCEHFGTCTTNKRSGRRVTRYTFEKVMERLEKRYTEPDAQLIFQRRNMRAEHPFGHIKRNLGAGYFLLRGLAGVKAEMALLTTGFNVKRMITLCGAQELITKLQTI